MTSAIRPLLVTGFALAVASLAINAFVSLSVIRRAVANNRRVLRTAESLRRLEATLSRLKDAETGQRGFLLTGQESYLEPYNAAVASLGEDLRGLATALDTPEQQRRVGPLDAKVVEELAELRQTIDLRRRQGPEAADRVVRSGRGKAIMDEIRGRVEELAGRERELLSQRVAESEADLGRVQVNFVITSLAVALMIVLLYLAIRRDLAARERSEGRLRGQLERWRVTLASIGDAVIVADDRCQVTFLNGRAESLCGWRRDEAVGQPLGEVFRIIDEVTRLAVESPVEKVFREGKIVGLANHTILVARDGREVPIDDSAAPIVDDRGEVAGVILVFRDVTEARRTAELKERLAAIVESSDDIIVSEDLDGIIRSWNHGAERILGYAAEEIIGRHVSVLTPPGHAEDTDKILGRIRRGETVTHYETRRRRKDGTDIDVSLTISPIWGGSGRVVGASKIGREITQQKLIEAERREADRRKDEFLAMLAHELRNPLAAIRSAVEVIDLPDAQDDLGWAKEVIGRQVNHLAHLLDDLLDVSRITRGLIAVRKQPIEASRVINQAVESVRSLIDDRHHRLEVSIAPRPLRLEADPVRLEQVLVNLLTNAARYTPAGGRITLSADRAGDQVIVRVADTGMGIAPEVLPRIFELFAQGERALARSEGGLGVGLTIVRKLVELHDGSVSARSEGPGRGSEFIVRLPASGDDPSSPSAPAGPAAGRAGCRVLIVDDNQDLARSLGRLLKLLGHEVELAYDGPEGIEAVRSYRPEVLLLDIGLPTLDGYSVARRLRQEGFREMRIIAVSGYGREEDRRRSREAGMDDHLTKPVDLKTISELIARPN